MIFEFDAFSLDGETLELRRDDAPVRVDGIVVKVLATLVERAGHLVTKEELVARVWGNRAVSENVITVAMARLRKALGGATHEPFVTTVHRRGYRFVRAVAVKDASTRPSWAPVATAALRPFVGRERVLGRLRESIAEAQAGRGNLCVLSGDAGIGKTRAVEMVEADARSAGFFVAWGHCREAGDTPPLWPFVEIVREILDAARVDVHEERLEAALTELGRLVPGVATTSDATSVRPSPDGVDALGNYRTIDAIVRVLGLCAEQRPLFLVLDDLHRADSASIEVVRYVVETVARKRIALVTTLRPFPAVDGSPRMPLGYVLGHRNTVRVVLAPLEAADVARYVASVVQDADGSLGIAIFQKSEGNAFLMTELARGAIDAGDGSAQSLAIPGQALDLLRQRVSTVDDISRGVLSTAAVIGRSFDLGVLGGVSELDAKALMACIDVAIERGILVIDPESATTFAFTHDLLRAVLYDALTGSERRALHGRMVDVLERKAANGGRVEPADLAYHAYASLPECDARRVVSHCVDAATAAAEMSGYQDAVTYLAHALDALALVPEPSIRFRLGLGLRRALYARVCSSPQFDGIARETLRLARDRGAPSVQARVALLLDVHLGFPAYPGASAILEEALAALPREDEEARGALLARLVTHGAASRDERVAGSMLDESRALAEHSGSLLATYTERCARLFSMGGPAHDAVAKELFAELDGLCESHPKTLSATPALLDLNRAIRAAQRGDAVGADSAILRCEERCRRLGAHELLWHANRFHLLARVNRGDDSAFAALRELHRRGEVESTVGSDVFIAFDRGVVFGDTRIDGNESLSLDPNDSPGLWSLKMRALAAVGRTEEARRLLRAIPADDLARLPCDRDYVGTLGAATRVALTLNELDYVHALEPLLAKYTEHVAVHVAFYVEGPVSSLLDEARRALAGVRAQMLVAPALQTRTPHTPPG
jgi:DNA-binding winged helix-turn-helix (wHTH) protein